MQLIRNFIFIILVLSINPIFANEDIDESGEYIKVIQNNSEEIQMLKNRIEILEGLLDEAMQQQVSDSPKYKNQSKLAVNADKADYDLALATLKERDFASAEKQFAKFIVDFPNSELQSNAHFWYGETFYQRGLFDRATSIYLKGYKKFPTGPKAADSLLKASFALASSNRKSDACIMLDKINHEFPNIGKVMSNKVLTARMKFMCNKIRKTENGD